MGKCQAPEELIIHKSEGDPNSYDFDNITPKSFINEQSQESVCSGDERIKVIDTSILPFKAICKLYMKAANGKNFIGTGWLTHANKLYTAGHCVYDHDEGGWMDSIIVVPGKSGISEPFGRYNSSDLVAANGWIEDRSRRYDVGAIKLSSNVSHSDFLSPSPSDSDTATVCGYPGDRDTGIFQYRMRNSIRKNNGRFFYQIDTFGGQSGGPLLRNNGIAIGIHNYGGCDNSASDLFQGLIDFVESW